MITLLPVSRNSQRGSALIEPTTMWSPMIQTYACSDSSVITCVDGDTLADGSIPIFSLTFKRGVAYETWSVA